MSSSVSRRDFLKLMAFFSAGAAASWTTARVLPASLSLSSGNKPNIIMLVTDTTSATNLSLYGYPRRTTPSLEKFAERATVYHSHHSGGSFTTAGTASLLTGSYPWSHRAINQMGLVDRETIGENIFDLIGNEYYRFAFTQNMAADVLLGQFYRDIDQHLSPTSFSLRQDPLMGNRFKDSAIALNAYDDFLFNMQNNPGIPGSLLLGLAYKAFHLRKEEYFRQIYWSSQPRGLPVRRDVSLDFLNDTVYNGLKSEIHTLMDSYSPFLAYFHLWSPHEPYTPSKEFMTLFRDKYEPVKKPKAHFYEGYSDGELNMNRGFYDRYIANVDDEIGKLLESLDQAGLLQNSYVIYTSDHGQMHERGILGHITPHLYDPLIHIPLMISAPGQTSRKDIYTHTSSIDVLPTLLHVAGREMPSGNKGQLLPGLGGTEDSERSIFTVEAKTNSAFAPLSRTTIAMIKGDYKLIYYKGYEGYDNIFELYNLREDSEELQDLAPKNPSNLASLKEELLENLALADKPFIKK
jgi:arylsulfatase A-like enzyme